MQKFNTIIIFLLTIFFGFMGSFDIPEAKAGDSDFKIQRGYLQVSNINNTITAGTDYEAPASISNAFIRITNTQTVGAGDDSLGGGQSADDVTVYISNPENLLSSITFSRFATSGSNTRVTWEIVEYIGSAGGPNEMVVRDQGTITYSSSASWTYVTVAGVTGSNLVPFITAQANPDTGAGDYNTGISTTFWYPYSYNRIYFQREETGGDEAIVSWAAVEFIGSNWKVQRSEHVYSSAGVVETRNITPVNDLDRAFLYVQKRVGLNLSGLDEFGHEVWLSATDTISFMLHNSSSNPSSQRTVAWVIENTQTDGNPMNVTRSNGIQSGGSEPTTVNVNIGKTLDNLSEASIFTNNRVSGSGTAYPRPIMGVRLISNTQYELWISDTGQTRTYRTEVVEWPTAPPEITAISTNSEQIGNTITISGDYFGSAGGDVINTMPATVVGEWSDTSLTVLVPGQAGVANITGKTQVTRSIDGSTSNLYPLDPVDFTILAPTVTGSNPTSARTEQETVIIDFFGLGIDTDAGTPPSLRLVKAGETDIVGTNYVKITDYQTVRASFNLMGATTGYWRLVVTNMDTQSGSFGDEITTGFNILPAFPPIVTGIKPEVGIDVEIIDIDAVFGKYFQKDAKVKLTKTNQADIYQDREFIFEDPATLIKGSFDLRDKTLGWWSVVVTNPDLQSGSYGNEVDSGFSIISKRPSPPVHLYQFKDDKDTKQPPTANIAVGGGVGEEVAIFFRMDMWGGLEGDEYFPQVEVKPIGGAFECDNSSPSPCHVTSGYFEEGKGVFYEDTPVQGWVYIKGEDGDLFHWQARARNPAGESDWVSFGENNDPNDLDVYLDLTPPKISFGTDGTCATAAIDITDLGATIIWDSFDKISGSELPPGSGAYATAQVQYIKADDFVDWDSTPGMLSAENPRENSPHQVAISGLSPGVEYVYRMISKDAVNNTERVGDCAFETESSRPIKTVELFILQESEQNTGTRISKNFNIYIPESPSTDVSVRSAFIEISGISSATANQTINIELRRGNGQLYVPAGADYTIDSTGTTTLFTILFDALNPPGSGQENMSNITTGTTDYGYTLFLNGTAIPTSAFSAKLVLTYSYVL